MEDKENIDDKKDENSNLSKDIIDEEDYKKIYENIDDEDKEILDNVLGEFLKDSENSVKLVSFKYSHNTFSNNPIINFIGLLILEFILIFTINFFLKILNINILNLALVVFISVLLSYFIKYYLTKKHLAIMILSFGIIGILIDVLGILFGCTVILQVSTTSIENSNFIVLGIILLELSKIIIKPYIHKLVYNILVKTGGKK